MMSVMESSYGIVLALAAFTGINCFIFPLHAASGGSAKDKRKRGYIHGEAFSPHSIFAIVRIISLGKHCHGYEILLRRLVGAHKGAAPPRFFTTDPVMILAGR